LKKTIVTGAGAALALASVILLALHFLRGSPSEPPAPVTRVEVKVVRPTGVADTLVFDAQGKVAAKKRFAVTALSEGKIGKVFVFAGEEVKKGQEIALLENRELDSELSLQGDKLRMSRETVQVLEKKVKTSGEMRDLGVVSENDFTTLKEELNSRNAELRDIEIAYERLKGREKNYRIVAGTGGFVTDLLPEESFVTYGQAVAEIISTSDEQVEAFVPFDRAGSPSRGDMATISCNGMTVPGKVAGTFPSAESNLIRVIVVPEKPVPMNLDVTVTFRVSLVNGLMIPKSAVVMDEGRQVVYLVTNNIARKKVITVIKDYIDRVVIADDLGPDAVLVTENPYLLSDQMNVVVK
jgi:RND family efflux transporter MFP subunit